MLFDLMAFIAAIGLIGSCLSILSHDPALAGKVRRMLEVRG